MAEGGGGAELKRQNTEDISDLPLQISISAISDHFQCPICMSSMDQACITHCGHRFCYDCIEECINRRHECPCCKKELYKKHLIRDHSFDALIKTVYKERKKSEESYYRKLVDDATNASADNKTSDQSPLEVVLKKHLTHTLAVHESLHQRLIVEYRRGLGKVEQEKQLQTERVMRLYPHDPDHPERLARVAEIEKKGEEKKKLLAHELERVEKLLTAAYDKYLTEYIPSPSTIPVTVTLTVPDRKFSLPDVVLRPEETIATVLKKLHNAMEEKGMRILEFPKCEEFTISIISPFSPTSSVSSPGDEASVAEGDGSYGNPKEPPEKGKGQMNYLDQVIHPDCRPVLEFSLKQGTELRFKGDIVLEGEISSLCFAASFVKGQSKSVDYFSCQECGFNWVCHSCAEICHNGHTVLPYARNHKPTWACCYCPKKKTCIIQKKPQS